PIFFGHTLNVHINTLQALPVEAAAQALQQAGLRFVDRNKPYATALGDAGGTDDVWVSRLRRALTQQKGLSFNLASDNRRKGSALNMVHIAQQWLHQQV